LFPAHIKIAAKQDQAVGDHDDCERFALAIDDIERFGERTLLADDSRVYVSHVKKVIFAARVKFAVHGQTNQRRGQSSPKD
jgi:hypothetical protein